MTPSLRQLAPGLTRWLRAHRPVADDVRVDSVSPASEGYSNVTAVVSVTYLRATVEEHEKLVLRLPPSEGLFPEYDFGAQSAVHAAVADAAIPAPVPAEAENNPSWIGSPFLVMPFVGGHVPGQAPALDAWITGMSPGEQELLHDAFVHILASIHSVEWHAASLAKLLRGARGGLDEELRWWIAYDDWSREGEPPGLTSEALEWCAERRPRSEPPPSLLWGDPRLGNVIVADSLQIVAVLDWEMATIGPAEMDLAWYLSLSAVTDELIGTRVPGFPDRSETLSRYEARLGRRVADLDWYETFALARSSAIAERQARLAERAGSRRVMPAGERSPMAKVLRLRMEAWDRGHRSVH